MSLVDNWLESQKGASAFGKIRCPRNYVLKPGHPPFKMIQNPRCKTLTDSDIEYFNREYKMKLSRWICARDRNGNKIQDFNSYYQPLVSRAYIVEHTYDPLNPICRMQCRGKCLEGIGSIHTKTIKRLNGG